MPKSTLLGADGSGLSKRQMICLARQAAFVLQRQRVEDMGMSDLDRWSQHSFRVAGSQMFARARVPLPEIQVIGRWGSLAVMRYVQEAVFDPGTTAAQVASALMDQSVPQPTSTPLTPNSGTTSAEVEQLVRRIVAESMSAKGNLVHNNRTKFAHKPSESENNLPSETACGKWRYGVSSCLRHHQLLEGFKKGAVCFGEMRVSQDVQSESASDSSSSQKAWISF